MLGGEERPLLVVDPKVASLSGSLVSFYQTLRIPLSREWGERAGWRGSGGRGGDRQRWAEGTSLNAPRFIAAIEFVSLRTCSKYVCVTHTYQQYVNIDGLMTATWKSNSHGSLVHLPICHVLFSRLPYCWFACARNLMLSSFALLPYLLHV